MTGALAGAAAATLAASALATGLVRRYALSTRLLDIPNSRSSHTASTPRGGGLAVVASLLVGLAVRWVFVAGDRPLVEAIAGGGGLLAIVGFIDDRRGLSARLRLLWQFAAAGWLLFALHGAPLLNVFGVSLAPGLITTTFLVVYVVWYVNLFNFMDGIDGIAGIQAVTVGLAGAFTSWLATAESGIGSPILLASAAAGFLWWNVPRARIFLGDVGSGFLGATIAAFSLAAGHSSPSLFWSWNILMGCFVVDATFTLLRRLTRGEAVMLAHRSHAYQFASRRLGSHVRVSLAVGLINIGWLLPLAAVVARGKIDGAVGLVIAYSPLVLLAWRLHAGDAVAQSRYSDAR